MDKFFDEVKECIFDDNVECLEDYIPRIDGFKVYAYFAAINGSYKVLDYFFSNDLIDVKSFITDIIFHYCESKEFNKLLNVFNIISRHVNIHEFVSEYMIEYLLENLIKNIGTGNVEMMNYITKNFSDICYNEKSIIIVISNINDIKKIGLFYVYLENGNVDIDKFDLYDNVNNLIYELLNYKIFSDTEFKEFLGKFFSLVKCNRKNLFKIKANGMKYVSSVFFKMLRDEYYSTFFYYFSSAGENLDYLKYFVSQIPINDNINFNYIMMGIGRTTDDEVYSKVFSALVSVHNFLFIVLHKMDERDSIISNKIISNIVQHFNLTGIEDLKIIKNLLL